MLQGFVQTTPCCILGALTPGALQPIRTYTKCGTHQQWHRNILAIQQLPAALVGQPGQQRWLPFNDAVSTGCSDLASSQSGLRTLLLQQCMCMAPDLQTNSYPIDSAANRCHASDMQPAQQLLLHGSQGS